jgi:hypothetical protein
MPPDIEIVIRPWSSGGVKNGLAVLITSPFCICLNLKLKLKLLSKLIYDRQSVGQSILVSGTHLGPGTNFSFSIKFPLDSCGFVIL